LFKQSAGIELLHVPYRTSPEVLAALLSKNVDVVVDTITALLGQVESGQVIALGVTGKDRFPTTPNIPPVIESGVVPGYDVNTWYGLYGPKGMPPAVIAKLNATLNEMLAEPTIRERLGKIGAVVKGSTPAEFAQLMAAEHAKWGKVREAAGLEQK
jgi:tripartite-type tricarboxylate transporter receptor subunit TctC